MSNSRRYIRGAVALFVALGLGSTALPASADRNSINDKKRQQQQVRQQRALIASQINTLKASDQQIESALKALNANVQGTQAQLESAQNALAQANHDAEVARQGIESATSSISSLQTTLAGLAVDSYVHPLGDTMLAVLNTTNISDAAQKRAFLTVVHQRDADVADQIKQAREDLTTQRENAQDAAARAESSRQAITAELQKLHDAQSQQMQFEDKVQARLDAALSESAVLESQDKELAAEIARDQAALAAQLRARGWRARHRAPADRQHQRGQCGWDLREHADRRQRALPSSRRRRPTECRSPDGVIATRTRRSRFGRRTADRANTRSTRCPRTSAHRRPRRPARRCTSAGWRSTSPTAARRSAATAAPGTSGSPPTPRSTACTTCRRSPGTGRRTATSAQRAPREV